LPGENFPWTPSETGPAGPVSVGVQGEFPLAGVLGAAPLDFLIALFLHFIRL